MDGLTSDKEALGGFEEILGAANGLAVLPRL
jgi:hypothetical protein